MEHCAYTNKVVRICEPDNFVLYVKSLFLFLFMLLHCCCSMRCSFGLFLLFSTLFFDSYYREIFLKIIRNLIVFLALVVTFFVFYFATLAVFYSIVVLCLLWSQCVSIEDKGQQRNKRQERLRNKTKGAKIKMAVFRGHCCLRIVYVWLNVPNIHFAQTTVTSYK
jgi:predicted membrane protein